MENLNVKNIVFQTTSFLFILISPEGNKNQLYSGKDVNIKKIEQYSCAEMCDLRVRKQNGKMAATPKALSSSVSNTIRKKHLALPV